MAAELKKTVKPAGQGGDYTTLSACIVANAQDLVTADKYFLIEIDGTWSAADTTAVSVNGYTTDATRYINIYTTATARHSGIYTSNAYLLQAANIDVLTVSEDYVRVSGLQVEKSGSDSHYDDVVTVIYVGTSDIRFDACIFKGSGNDSYRENVVALSDSELGAKLWNCILYNGSTYNSEYSSGIYIPTTTTVAIYSTTIVGSRRGIYRIGGTVTAKNVYAGGGTTADYAGTITMTTCGSSDATGTAGLQSIAVDTDTFVNVTGGTEDFHLAADGESPLQDTGTDTSGDAAPLDFTDDIDGDARGGWDIGADEYSGGGAAGQPTMRRWEHVKHMPHSYYLGGR